MKLTKEERLQKMKRVTELVDQMVNASVELNRLWENEDTANDMCSKHYPFGDSFDDLLSNMMNWRDDLHAIAKRLAKKWGLS